MKKQAFIVAVTLLDDSPSLSAEEIMEQLEGFVAVPDEILEVREIDLEDTP